MIDDEADIRESLQALLELESYSVHLAGSGAEGVDKAGRSNYDLILLDLMMPDKSGMEVLAELRQRGVQRQNGGQVEVVLAPGQRLDAQARAVERRVGHDETSSDTGRVQRPSLYGQTADCREGETFRKKPRGAGEFAGCAGWARGGGQRNPSPHKPGR